ncbi:MAG: hypothetical protein WBA77_16545 [Microcoleaceae cyanobacterium]
MKSYKKQLKINPFTTYRDPETGRWIVIKTELREVEKKMAA